MKKRLGTRARALKRQKKFNDIIREHQKKDLPIEKPRLVKELEK